MSNVHQANEIDNEVVYRASPVRDRNLVANMAAMKTMLEMTQVPVMDFLSGVASHSKTALLVVAREAIENLMENEEEYIFELVEDVRACYDAFTQLPMMGFAPTSTIEDLQHFVRRVGAHRVEFLKNYVVARFGIAEEDYKLILPMHYIPETERQRAQVLVVEQMMMTAHQARMTRSSDYIQELVDSAVVSGRDWVNQPIVPVVQAPVVVNRRRPREDVDEDEEPEDLFSPPRPGVRAHIRRRVPLNAIEAMLYEAGVPREYNWAHIDIAHTLAQFVTNRYAAARASRRAARHLAQGYESGDV
jgi:hypothetical protein